MSPSGIILQLKKLSKSFGSHQAVREVSFSVKKGSIAILAGADGAGKSTLLRMILGLVPKDSGRIILKGKPVEKDSSFLTSITGYMPERFSLYPDLSVEENMNFFASIHGVSRRRREELKNRLLQKTGMLPFKKRRAGALSGGMKQKLALSTILLSSPEIIILDEPTTGVDPLSRIEFFNIIDELKKEGKTIIISTPYLNEAERGDEIFFIKKGSLFMTGEIRKLKEAFPVKIFRILPQGNILELWEKLKHKDDIRQDIYIRGRWLIYLERKKSDFLKTLPALEIHKEQPRLEDIYLFYEREKDARPAA